MRQPLYLMTIASCLILSGMFFNRGQMIPAVLAGGAALFYLFRLFWGGRTAPATTADGEPVPQDESTSEVRERLEAKRRLYEGNSKKFSLVAVAIALGGMVAMLAGNSALAIALLIGTLPFVILVFRNGKAVRMIDDAFGGKQV